MTLNKGFGNNCSIFFYKNFKKIFISLFLLSFALQIIFQIKTEHLKPNVHVVPPLPSKYTIEALSFGDEEFYFRILALKIQNAGDSFGRSTPLKNYDYSKLYEWFKILDSLNSESRIIPSIASYYYSQTQHKEDVKYLIKYLDEHASVDINKNWWWLYQATYLAKFTLKDQALALNLAYKLSKNEDARAPLWTKQLPAFLLAENGQDCEAFFVISQLLQDNASGKREIKPDEMDFMRHFIKERLASFKENKFDPRKCQKIN